MPFSILQVTLDDTIRDEQLGSKPKFWFSQDGHRWLFKEARPNTGEDWAEKLGAEIAHRVGISVANVELAASGERRGCASQNFLMPDVEDLIHGNEILGGSIVGYEADKRLKQSDHTLSNIIEAIQKLVRTEAEYRPILTQLAGYLVLDALIGNTDRHHENWGLIARYPEAGGDNPDIARAALRVAPSFDHASSLGRELLPARIEAINTPALMEGYIRGGRGGIYLASTDRRGANPLELVEVAAKRYPRYFSPALQQVAAVSVEEMVEFVANIPADRMSEANQKFVGLFLTYSHTALTKLLQ